MTKAEANQMISGLLNSAAAYRDSSEADHCGIKSERTKQLRKEFNVNFLKVRNLLLKVEAEENE